MEALGIGDLHLLDAAGMGSLSKYVPNADKMVIDEVERVLQWGRERGIKRAFFYGDLSDSPRMGYEGMMALSGMLSRNDDFQFEIIPGNHDMFGETPRTGHSLEVLVKLYSKPNVRFHLKPKTVDLDGAKVRFLPYPHEKFDVEALNVFHKEVYGSSGDSGRLMKDETLSKSKAVVVAGHLHTAHRVRNTHYCGTLYQTNFGEKLPKYFHHIEFNTATDYSIELIPHEPKYKLHTVILNDRQDLKEIPKGQFNLVKLVIADGADVSVSDWADLPNIVEIKNFKSKEELQAVLVEDLTEGTELVIKVDDFFREWVGSLEIDEGLRSQMKAIRRRVLKSARANTEIRE